MCRVVRVWLLACWVIVWLSGCSHVASSSVEVQLDQMQRLGFHPVDAQPYVKSWLKQPALNSRQPRAAVLHVYLEGDGAAWWARRLPPTDPTPRTSVALPMALEDPHPAVAYLARPCQYLTGSTRTVCPVAWWTSARWSEPVVAMTDQVLSALLQASGARELVLTGHSGGGTLAVLVAARRRDVRCVITVASPLDVEAWAVGQGVTPLSESLNPADLPTQDLSFQMRHLLGLDDRTVPASSVGRFGAHLQPESLIQVPRQGHAQGWLQHWRNWGDTQPALSAWMRGCLNPA